MKKEERIYLYVVLFHVAIGMALFVVPFTAKLYGYSIFIFGAYYVIKNQNRNNEALMAAAYVVGSEVLLRMTGGNITYEFSKYGVMIFIVLGAYFSGFSKSALPYWLFLLLLVPSVVLSAFVLNFDTNIRTTIAFNISGPVCLGIASLYTFRRSIVIGDMNSLLLCIGLPIVSTTAYLALYTPNVQEVITGTGSNFETSGGFGPNQVATVLGLGMFIFFSRVILESKSKFMVLLNLILAFNITYRGMVTFSRGGMITGFLMIILLLVFLYLKSNYRGKVKLNFIFVLIGMTMALIWGYAYFQTGGLINNRYANQDAYGNVKASTFTGREIVAQSEIDMFLEHPVFGVGVAKGAEIRETNLGMYVTSHDEITRLLAEHGFFGILALLILLFTPFFLFLENKFNMFLLCFLVFWFLTINHAAMRTAAPAFLYALALFHIDLVERPQRQNES